jgi:hypothetical protein
MMVKAGWLLGVEASIKGSVVNSIKGVVGEGKAKLAANILIGIF